MTVYCEGHLCWQSLDSGRLPVVHYWQDIQSYVATQCSVIIEHRCVRCACTPAIPSPFHNTEDVDRRNAVNIEGNHYAICPVTKEVFLKKRYIKCDSVTCHFLSLVVINERLDGVSGTLIS